MKATALARAPHDPQALNAWAMVLYGEVHSGVGGDIDRRFPRQETVAFGALTPSARTEDCLRWLLNHQPHLGPIGERHGAIAPRFRDVRVWVKHQLRTPTHR